VSETISSITSSSTSRVTNSDDNGNISLVSTTNNDNDNDKDVCMESSITSTSDTNETLSNGIEVVSIPGIYLNNYLYLISI
jgi:hypothetical protein